MILQRDVAVWMRELSADISYAAPQGFAIIVALMDKLKTEIDCLVPKEL